MNTAVPHKAHTASPPHKNKILMNAVRAAIYPLMTQVTGPNAHRPGPARGRMATLRRAAGRQLDDPLAWGVCTEMLLEHAEDNLVEGDSPTVAEEAAFIAVTLWALHQQSQEKPMHESHGGSDSYQNFGYAIGQLATRVESGSLKNRLDAVLLAGELSSLKLHLRTLIQLLKREELALDYGILAHDLYRWMEGPKGKRQVSLAWGRGFARGQHTHSSATQPSATTTH